MKNVRLFFSIFAALFLCTQLPRSVQADPATGVYRLTTRGHLDMALDVKDFANANSTPVLLWTSTKASNQQWLVERQGDGSYKIYAYSGQNSMQMLDCATGATTNGTNVTTYEDNGNNAQRWFFKDVGNGWYRIIPKNAGIDSLQTLDVRNGNNAKAGDTLNIYSYYGGDNQVFRLDWAGVAKLLPNPKKGIGGRPTKTPYMNASWYYTWGADKPADAPGGIEFVPMEWGYYDGAGGNAGWLSWVKSQPGVNTILAFNEPDHTDQSNLSVESALQGYRFLAEMGIPVGSPACADPMSQWMLDFMNGATSRGYRVDYVAIHSYIRDPYQFLNYIEQVHNRYWQYPLWITEFAPTDWASPSSVTTAEVENFMKIVVPELNRRWYVARYAWYTGSDPGGDWVLSSAGLVNYDGRLTEMGRLYSRM